MQSLWWPSSVATIPAAACITAFAISWSFRSENSSLASCRHCCISSLLAGSMAT